VPKIIYGSRGGGGGGTDDQTAAEVPVDTTNFDNNLGSGDTNVQLALETLDDLVVGAGGVSGPVSSTDTAVALWNGTGGDTLKDSSIIESELETLTDGSNADSLHVHSYGDGDVSGPGSSVDNRIVLFDGGTGKLIKSSDAFIVSSSLTIAGNIILSTPLAQVDGVDISAHALDANAHHGQIHGLNSHTQGSNKIFMTKDAVFTEIAVGTSGTYLKSNGPSADLTWDTPGGGGAPTDATYVTLSTNATLTDERVLTAGTAITVTDGGAGSTVTVGVTASSIGTTQLTNDGVTNAKLANMAQATLKGRAYAAGTGDPTDLTPAQGRKILIESYTALTYAASITPNASAASKFSLTLTGDCTINVPTNLITGQTIEYRIKQDGTGGHTVTWHADYETGELPTVAVASGADEYTHVLCKHYSTGTKMHIVAFMRGYL